MTTYTAITAAQIDADSYLDTVLMGQLTNNVLAMFEGDASASAVRLQIAALADGIAPWVRLSTQDASADSSIDFSNLIDGTYDQYIVTLSDIRPATDGSALLMRIGTGATPTWQATLYGYHYIDVGMNVANLTEANANSTTSIPLTPAIDGAAIHAYSGIVNVFNPQGASTKRIKASGGYGEDTGNAYDHGIDVWGTWDSATIITSLRFLMSSGNITSGTFTLYGLIK